MLSKMLRGSVNNTTNPAGATDPNFNQVSLLLHGDGTNGAQNNTFLDSSTNNFTVTRNGNTTQGTNTPFSQADGYWSNYFDGSSYLNATSSTFSSTGNFTMECWGYVTSISNYGGLITMRNSANSNGGSINILNTGYFDFEVYPGGGYTSTLVPLNQWFHVALVRSGSGTNNCSCYLNGNRIGQFTSNSEANGASNVLSIGRYYSDSNNYYLNGYVSNVRYVVGTAVYSGTTYTVPTTPLTAITNTSLLTCQSNYFKDNSSNNFAITATGTPSVQPFSPFAPTSAYSTSVNGGSMYFDATGDYLTTANSTAYDFGSNSFTIECWIYTGLTGVNAQQTVIERRGTGFSTGDWIVYLSDTASAVTFYAFDINSGAAVVTYAGLKLNSWQHIAVVRSGTTFTLYLNGVSVTSSTSSTAIASNSLGITVGRDNVSGGRFYFNGYISNARIVNGTAVYTANFTPPTAPLTAITNTSLLLSGTNAGIYDNAIKNDLETVGDAQVSTSVVKYGTGSIKFDGTGDYLTLPSTPNLAMGSGNFTWECWVYTSAGSYFQAFISSREGSGNTGLYLGTNNATLQVMVYEDTGFPIASSINLTANTWTHVALVRNSTVLTLYIGGTSAGSATYTTNLTSTFYKIGCDGKASQGLFLNGYIDDLRITKGIARYTANFTPPTAAFPNN